MSMLRWSALLAAFSWASPVWAVEIRAAPAEQTIFAANPDAGIFDLVVPAVGVRAGAGERITVESMRLEFWSDNAPMLVRSVPASQIIDDTARLANAPAALLVTGALLNSEGVDGFFGASTRLSEDAELTAGEALFTTRRVFSFDFAPSAMRVVVHIRDVSGAPAMVSAQFEVRPRQTSIEYSFPLRGPWLMNAYPSMQSHHRLLPGTEFGVDLFRVGPRGLHRGDDAQSRSFYGYGEPVFAAADGEVVRVIDDMPNDRAQRLAARNADADAFFARHVAALNENALRAAGGNVVIIRHEQDGEVEYSTYAHLMAGSIKVEVGQRVDRGAQIARVGDTAGEPVDPHLHFQVNLGPDMLHSPTLPIRFNDIAALGPPTDLGYLVTAPGR